MSTPKRRIACSSLMGSGYGVPGGDHVMLTKPGIRRPVVIKKSPGEVPVTHILTNMRTAGMSRDTYFRLLNDVT